ncbi:PREDICTED: protein RRP6-like 2 isoform X2 [Lupinus angustifolius]|uniref:protein RRP6-like 2 isoform X2 n=1 Tax=Lupinus angustifolius TaxID=3871 RepID=UPI00092F264F|nr:PREDICTED: protein RRP6-like 2 isoform X2 [Lupinus angustifolius]
MNFDPASAKSSQILNTIKEISSSSRTIPSDKDFKLCYTSDEFKRPIDEIARKSNSMLQKIGAAKHIWGTEEADFPVGIDDAYEWLVDVNQEVFGRVDESIKELQKIMKFEDDEMELENGKKKKMKKVRVETKDKEKVSFHISAIEKPQNRYNFLVNNANQPFQHVWLERSDDGQRFIHPLEKLSVLDFVDKDVEDLVPIEPPSLESTPFKLVEEVKGLKELAAKLHSVNEFAVDLEHNHYRSFQGLTCLMQISTRTEDFIVDTLKLRVHVGPYLRELFKDPTKKKVMHGADSDIVWLQRDFGIYVCNLFDTGQASRVLKLERFSLQYLLLHYCGVIANKEYQKADWRLRPLPDVMLRYGREDTHYLLYIYDLMRIKLLALSKESESSDNLLVEVYKRSYDVCMKLYEKELLTEDSYLHIYGLQGASFNGQQLAIVSGLYEWRDIVARAEDEGTGYVLPNKTILEIAKQMPVTTSHLRRLVNLYLPYIERNLDVILSIVRHSVQNAPAFEEAALRLKEAHTASVSNALSSKDKAPGTLAKGSTGIENVTSVNISEKAPFSSDLKEESFQHQDKNGQITTKSNCPTSELPKAKEEVKLEQIGSSINLPLHSGTISTSTPADVIMIDSDTDSEDMAQNNVGRDNEQRENEDEDDSSSFSDLSL